MVNDIATAAIFFMGAFPRLGLHKEQRSQRRNSSTKEIKRSSKSPPQKNKSGSPSRSLTPSIANINVM
jgi:hypothetical protein